MTANVTKVKSRHARVLLGDDHLLVVEGFRNLLEAEFSVVGTAMDGKSLVEQALRLKPEVVLVGISMPHLNGLDAARQIKRHLPDVKIVFLTMHADLSYLRDALRLGASGYILKRSTGKELLKAVRDVLAGRIYVAPELTAAIEDPQLRKAIEQGRVPVLTTRQQEILRLIASGKSNREIADFLHITVKTVRWHRLAIAGKLGMSGTAALTRYAITHGFIGTPKECRS